MSLGCVSELNNHAVIPETPAACHSNSSAFIYSIETRTLDLPLSPGYICISPVVRLFFSGTKMPPVPRQIRRTFVNSIGGKSPEMGKTKQETGKYSH